MALRASGRGGERADDHAGAGASPDGVAGPTGDGESVASGPVGTVSTADGRTVAYSEYGDPEGRPVVVCHGTPGSRVVGALYDATARERGVRLLAPDRPGYGRSDPWPDRTLADTGEFLAPVLDDAGVDRADVVGFSGGGPHALALAATRGDRVRTVDLVATATPPDCGEAPRQQRLLGTLATRTPRALTGLLRAAAWVARRRSPTAVLAQFTADPGAVSERAARLVHREFCVGLADSPTGVVAESRLLADEWSVSPAAVDAPVRLWHGSDDANVPVESARAFADRLPDAELTVLPGRDHLRTLLATRGAVLDAGSAGERQTSGSM